MARLSHARAHSMSHNANTHLMQTLRMCISALIYMNKSCMKIIGECVIHLYTFASFRAVEWRTYYKLSFCRFYVYSIDYPNIIEH